MNKFDQTTPPIAQQQQPANYADRQFLHTFTAAALLPLVQATITAIVAGVATATVLYLFDAIDWVKPIVAVSGLTWVITWLYLQRRWLNLTYLEQVLGKDLNRDRVIGKPEKAVETVIRIQDVKDNGHFQETRARLPEHLYERLPLFADGVINKHRPISRREWTPKSKGFSDDDYRVFQSALLKYGLIEQVGAGFDLTRAGRAMMTHYASLFSPIPAVNVPEM